MRALPLVLLAFFVTAANALPPDAEIRRENRAKAPHDPHAEAAKRRKESMKIVATVHTGGVRRQAPEAAVETALRCYNATRCLECLERGCAWCHDAPLATCVKDAPGRCAKGPLSHIGKAHIDLHPNLPVGVPDTPESRCPGYMPPREFTIAAGYAPMDDHVPPAPQHTVRLPQDEQLYTQNHVAHVLHLLELPHLMSMHVYEHEIDGAELLDALTASAEEKRKKDRVRAAHPAAAELAPEDKAAPISERAPRHIGAPTPIPIDKALGSEFAEHHDTVRMFFERTPKGQLQDRVAKAAKAYNDAVSASPSDAAAQIADRVRAALWCALLADAVAVPTHYLGDFEFATRHWGEAGLTTIEEAPYHTDQQLVTRAWMKHDFLGLRTSTGPALLGSRLAHLNEADANVHFGQAHGDTSVSGHLIRLGLRLANRRVAGVAEEGGKTKGERLGKALEFDVEQYTRAFMDFMQEGEPAAGVGHPVDGIVDVSQLSWFHNLLAGTCEPMSGNCAVPSEKWSKDVHVTMCSAAGLVGSASAAFSALGKGPTRAFDAARRQLRVTHANASPRLEATMEVYLNSILRSLVASHTGSFDDSWHVHWGNFEHAEGPEDMPGDPVLRSILLDACDALGIELEEMRREAEGWRAAHRNPHDRPRADGHVIHQFLSVGFHTHDAIPAAMYLAYRYVGAPFAIDGEGHGHDELEDKVKAALLANANIGGDTVNRGILLGTILGANVGMEGVPKDLMQKLHNRDQIAQEIDAFADSLEEAIAALPRRTDHEL